MDDLISRQAFEKLPEPCEDMISRQQAIDEIKKHYRANNNDLLELIAFNIGRLPSTQPEQRWTPCSERLPTKKDSYLVTGRKSRDWYESDKIVTVAFYDGEFWTHNGDIQVEAWMPRPKPYKGEES